MEVDFSQLANNTPLMVFLAFLAFEIRSWRTSTVPLLASALYTLADAIDPTAAQRVVDRARGRFTPPVGVPVVRAPTAPTGPTTVGDGG